MGTLYIVGTPIGNLEDITLRALRVLGEVSLIAAEDTRTTKILLNHYNIRTRLTSYNEHNMLGKTPFLLDSLKTRDVALVSEAGMPGISDPGYQLVLETAKAGVPTVPIPGASAVTASLAVSGLPAQGSLFLGFLPRRRGERQRLMESLVSFAHTIVAFEAPHRVLKSLNDVLEVLGDRPIAVCRELTKVHEEVFRGTVSQAISHFNLPRGEFTLIIGPGATVDAPTDIGQAKDHLRVLRGQGQRAREAVATVSQASGLPRKEVYRLWLGIQAD